MSTFGSSDTWRVMATKQKFSGKAAYELPEPPDCLLDFLKLADENSSVFKHL